MISLAAAILCSSCGSSRSPGNAIDGSTREVANEAAANLLPLCCGGAVLLSPVGPDAPCSFAIPENVLPGQVTYPSDVLVYLNLQLVDPVDVDGGHSYELTTTTLVLMGAACNTVLGSPQDSLVYILCGPCGCSDDCGGPPM